MKKILIALIIMVPIAITGFLGYDFFKKNFAHVHGIIMYSDNKDEACLLYTSPSPRDRG